MVSMLLLYSWHAMHRMGFNGGLRGGQLHYIMLNELLFRLRGCTGSTLTLLCRLSFLSLPCIVICAVLLALMSIARGVVSFVEECCWQAVSLCCFILELVS